jgi:hypothetical protein
VTISDVEGEYTLTFCVYDPQGVQFGDQFYIKLKVEDDSDLK